MFTKLISEGDCPSFYLALRIKTGSQPPQSETFGFCEQWVVRYDCPFLFTKINKNYMKKNNTFLDPNEKIIWQGRERFLPRFLFLILRKLLIAFIILIFTGVFLAIASIANNKAMDNFLSLFLFMTFIILIYIIYVIILHHSVNYLITNKRAIGWLGVIKRNFKFIDFDKIQNIEIKISFLDRMIGNNTGSIIIMSASQTLHFHHIANSFEVVKILKNTSYNIKTDISFPNAFRPKDNPGYNTKYK